MGNAGNKKDAPIHEAAEPSLLKKALDFMLCALCLSAEFAGSVNHWCEYIAIICFIFYSICSYYKAIN
jgi:hypothetical protein